MFLLMNLNNKVFMKVIIYMRQRLKAIPTDIFHGIEIIDVELY